MQSKPMPTKQFIYSRARSIKTRIETFEKCSVNRCPLDSKSKKRFVHPADCEQICTMSKGRLRKLMQQNKNLEKSPG
jgi:hypothetical protein